MRTTRLNMMTWYVIAMIIPINLCTASDYSALHKTIEREFKRSIEYQDVPNTLLLLKIIVDDAVRKGTKAPDYNLCGLRLAHTHLFCEENKNIPRKEMPQLKGRPVPGSQADKLTRDARGEIDATNQFADYLERTKNYTITHEMVPAVQLKATQNELVGSKVAGIWSAIQDPSSESYKTIMEEPLFISQDNYILDGHHRWAAAVAHAITRGNLAGLQLSVKRVHVGIDQLVNDANEFVRSFGIQEEKGL